MTLHSRFIPLTAVALVVAATNTAVAQTTPRDDAAAVEFFEKKVRPLLIDNCYSCHSAATNAKGGLRVDDRNGLIQGGNNGAAVVPGEPDKSLLIQAVRHADDAPKMPPKKQLTPEQVADLAQWVKDGAAWPKVEVPTTLGKANPRYDRLRKEHWAWQALAEPKLPAVKDDAWPCADVDRFILAGLEAKNLKPVADADRLTLIRRVTFDLTGLPPTPPDIDAFLKDDDADAFAKVVDRLLASSAFGERWGRHWLDVARYGESTGSSRNVPYPHAWRYRDYVIDSVNRDKPYDQFLREQIAGDLLPAESPAQRDEMLVATGFLALGVKDVNQRFKVRFIMDNIDEQIDTVTRSVLALTASCARCHDHKFDPIPAADYYALAGIFHSSDLCAGVRNKMGGGGMDYYDPSLLVKLGTAAKVDPKVAEQVVVVKKALEEAQAAFEAIRGKPEGKAPGPDGKPKQQVARQKVTKLQNELLALTDPAAHGLAALGVQDAKVVGDTEIRIRGEAEKLGPVVPRGFLTLVNVPDAPKIDPKHSGRLELAQWLTSPKNPLPPRVMANRVWLHLFGRGLVSSVDNFGSTGDVPSHPELLDYLANQFVHDGWSVKKLVRSLVLTRAYQLGAETTPANILADPANRLVWRHAPRRLDAEEIRDAMLAASGKLDAAKPEASPAKDLKVMEMANNGPLARRLETDGQNSLHRSVYLPLVRGLTPRSLEVFDFAEQGMVTGSRDTTTVATQALYLLNDPFVHQQALALAERVLQQPAVDDGARLEAAYRLTLGRPATTKEIERAKRYIADYEATAAKTPKQKPAKPKVDPEPETPKKPKPANPDEEDQSGVPVKEVVVEASDARTAAWASFCQALLGSVEFRYTK